MPLPSAHFLAGALAAPTCVASQFGVGVVFVAGCRRGESVRRDACSDQGCLALAILLQPAVRTIPSPASPALPDREISLYECRRHVCGVASCRRRSVKWDACYGRVHLVQPKGSNPLSLTIFLVRAHHALVCTVAFSVCSCAQYPRCMELPGERR